MILLLDVGNSQVFGGVYLESMASMERKEPVFTFRKSSDRSASSDEMGLFLMAVLSQNGINPRQISQIGIASVVPDAMHSIRGAIQKYFGITPFLLVPGVKTGLKIKYRNPAEVGADRIANSIAAVARFPGQNLIIVDMGTATTFCAVTSQKDYLGGAILAGLRISMEALESKTAKLPVVEILKPTEVCGRSPVESIQAGLYYGHLGAVKEICTRYQRDLFLGQKPTIIGTGGFARLFSGENLFDTDIPNLVLEGLLEAIAQNRES